MMAYSRGMPVEAIMLAEPTTKALIFDDNPCASPHDAPHHITFTLLIYQVSQQDGGGDLEPHRQDRSGIKIKDNGHDQAQDGDKDPEFEDTDDKEEKLGAPADIDAGDIGD